MSDSDSGSEYSVSSAYCVVYRLEGAAWNVKGEGWAQIHLYRDRADGSHRIVGWTVLNYEVVINCNVTAICKYALKSEDFHKFTDEEKNVFGFGFYKKEESLHESKLFMAAVQEAIKYSPSFTLQPLTMPPPAANTASTYHQLHHQHANANSGSGGVYSTTPPASNSSFLNPNTAFSSTPPNPSANALPPSGRASPPIAPAPINQNRDGGMLAAKAMFDRKSSPAPVSAALQPPNALISPSGRSASPGLGPIPNASSNANANSKLNSVSSLASRFENANQSTATNVVPLSPKTAALSRRVPPPMPSASSPTGNGNGNGNGTASNGTPGMSAVPPPMPPPLPSMAISTANGTGNFNVNNSAAFSALPPPAGPLNLAGPPLRTPPPMPPNTPAGSGNGSANANGNGSGGSGSGFAAAASTREGRYNSVTTRTETSVTRASSPPHHERSVSSSQVGAKPGRPPPPLPAGAPPTFAPAPQAMTGGGAGMSIGMSMGMTNGPRPPAPQVNIGANSQTSPPLSPTVAALTAQPSRSDLRRVSLSTVLPRHHHSNTKTAEDIFNHIIPLGKLKILPPKAGKGTPHHAHIPSTPLSITDVYTIIHTQHVEFDAKTRSYKGLPAEWESYVNQQFGIPPENLETIKVDPYRSRIPIVLIQMRDYLIQHNAYEVEGLFRIAPDASESSYAKQLVNENKLDSCADVHCIANLIKVWFRDLPRHVLDGLSFEQIGDCDQEDKAEKLVLSMDEPFCSLVLWLLDLCVFVASYQHVNRMSAKNLAIVFGPNTFTPPADPMAALLLSQKVVRFLELAINSRMRHAANGHG